MSSQRATRSDPVRLGLVTALVAIALILLPVAVAQADEFVVDMVADDAGASACTRDPNDCSLRGAVNAANKTMESDTIVLPDRILDLDLVSVLPPEDDNKSGDLDIKASGGSLRIMGEGAGETIIRGGQASLGITSGIDRVFHIDPDASGGIRVQISGVSIQYGYAMEYGGGILIEGDNRVELIDSSVMSNTVLVAGTPGGGGGIFNDEGTLILTNTDVMTNSVRGIAPNSDVAGGGILVDYTGVLTLTASTIAGNEATAIQLTGSSIRGGGLANLHGSMCVRHSAVSGNTATGGGAGSLGMGGGIANADAGRLTIDQQSYVSDNMADRYGGGLSNSGSPALIESSTFSGNKATGGADGLASKGGGIYNKIGSVQIVSSTIESNESATLETTDRLGTGGGLANSDGSVDLTGTSVLSNTADSDCAGVRNEAGGVLTMEGGALSANESAAAGGGLCNLQSSVIMTDTVINLNTAQGSAGGLQGSEDSISLTRCMIAGNRAYGGSGGGIYTALGTLHIADSTLYANRAEHSGGGLNSILSTMHITGTTFMGNVAADPTGSATDNHGGGMYVYAGTTHVVNSTFSGNRANHDGGGVYGSGATLSLSFTILANNMADADNDGNGDGGGILDGVEKPRIVNTILAGNLDRGGEAMECGGVGLYTFGDNIIQDRTGCLVEVGTGTNWAVDPLLDPLGDHGGEAETHALLAGSPAIDKAISNNCRTYQGLVMSQDQRGVSRPIGAACDIGAYEGALHRIYLPLVAKNLQP